jgi:prefoldin subunit 5
MSSIRDAQQNISALVDERDCLQSELESLKRERAMLVEANTALIQALDRLHDVVTGDDFVENSASEIPEIINKAIRLHNISKILL